MSRRRGVRVLKWLGAGLCVLIAAAFVASLWVHFDWVSPGVRLNVLVFRGGLNVLYSPDGPISFDISVFLKPGFDVGTHPFNASWAAWPKFYPDDRRNYHARLPLWLPFLALLLPTLLLWRLDHRHPPPGHCRCGYNLTGLTSTRCPECGSSIGATP